MHSYSKKQRQNKQQLMRSGECKRHQCIKEKTIVGQDNDVHA